MMDENKVNTVVEEDSNEKLKEVNKDLLVRLRRIEGQVKGIERMVEGNGCCRDILVQVSAVKAAMNKVGVIMFKNYANKCFTEDEKCIPVEKLDEIISTLLMFTK
ncbi:DNA-binding transcriptional regulator, FrmR family [Clostridium collagenovorans DSM 3089]|uniref:DNA-binding transcriptional regulator, FrmR family n=2 Tax=Clostridium TaxID=1485 RepID=A0A1M5YCI2_9CLOT|nr:DNA-binding transcriptional regulator, FrmR family [Clostridium collagenovorans DSM 3089]